MSRHDPGLPLDAKELLHLDPDRRLMFASVDGSVAGGSEWPVLGLHLGWKAR